MQGSKRALTWLATAAAAVGISVGAASLAGAATGSSSSPGTPAAATTTTPQAPADAPDPSKVDHGPGETLLTGDTAAKVTAAAKAAVPGATIVRVETDNGGVYEAHMQKSDGSFVTVKLDKSFKVTATDLGFGGGPGGGHGPGDGGPGAPGSSSSSSSSGTNGA